MSVRCQSEGIFYLGLHSLSGKTSYHQISWSLEAARFGFKLFQSLWNLAGTSAALLPRCLSNLRAIRPLEHPISRLRDFTRFGGKTSLVMSVTVGFWPNTIIKTDSLCDFARLHNHSIYYQNTARWVDYITVWKYCTLYHCLFPVC